MLPLLAAPQTPASRGAKLPSTPVGIEPGGELSQLRLVLSAAIRVIGG